MATFKKVQTKDGPAWRIQISVKGVRESATRTTKAEAVAWAAARETELRQAGATGIQEGRTVDEAFRRYEKEVSVHKRGHRWEAIRLAAIGRTVIDGKAIQEMKLGEVTPDFLGRWRDHRLKVDKVVGSTVNRDLNLLSHVFQSAAKEWKWVASSPTTNVRRPKDPPARDRLYTDDEIERLCFALGLDPSSDEPATTVSQRAAVALLFAIESAMRASEICLLMPDDVAGRVATLNRTKNGTKRDVPLSTRALALLKRLPAP
ncbi:MAG: tyrosine-type recombinase/integrase, partial [Telluria sp.]